MYQVILKKFQKNKVMEFFQRKNVCSFQIFRFSAKSLLKEKKECLYEDAF